MPFEQYANQPNAYPLLVDDIDASTDPFEVDVWTYSATGGNVRVRIDGEIIVGSIAGTTFTPIERGAEGTSPIGHTGGTELRMALTAQSLQNLIEKNIQSGDFADIPAAGVTGQLYFAEDTFVLYRDDTGGTADDWVAVATVLFLSADAPENTAATAVTGTSPDASHKDHVHRLGDHDHTATAGHGGVVDYSDISGTPTLADVATSGDYADLTGAPTIPTALADLTSDVDTVSVPLTDGDVLTWVDADSKWEPAAPSGGGGGLVLLEQHTASGSATLELTSISSTYDEYVLEFIDIVPATDDTVPYLRLGTGGGPTYDSGANYGWAGWRWLSSGSGATGADSGATQISLALAIHKATNWSPFCGSLKLFNPGSSAIKLITGQFASFDTAGNLPVGTSLMASYQSVTPVTGIQFLMSSGNITSGTVRLYGVEK